MSDYPIAECGMFHLTPAGWTRKDRAPFPDDRLESWYFEREQPAEDAKERVCFMRRWVHHDASQTTRDALHARFGMPYKPDPTRNLILECDI